MLRKQDLKLRIVNTRFRKYVLEPYLKLLGLTYNPILQTTFLDAASFGGDPGTTIQATFGQNGFPLLGYP
jgi:hypothetical protein